MYKHNDIRIENIILNRNQIHRSNTREIHSIPYCNNQHFTIIVLKFQIRKDEISVG